jgi:flagellar motor component MotA
VDSNYWYNITSIIGNILMFAMMFGGFFALKGSIGQATNEAQQSAIEAMRSELDTLRSRMDDLKEENKRQQNIIQTICEALKTKGIIICINGDIVHIRDDKDTISKRIQEREA